MVLPNSHKAPRTPCYSGVGSKEGPGFRVRGSHALWPPVRRVVPLAVRFLASSSALPHALIRSHDPNATTPAGLALHWFRLFPFRSPLLGKSLLLSVPPGTEMVHFPGSASSKLFGSPRGSHRFTVRGSPIRTSADHWVCAPPRGFSQLTTSFLAFTRLGIHRVPLVACQFPQLMCYFVLRHACLPTLVRLVLSSLLLFVCQRASTLRSKFSRA
jgi:hypothetical protein